MVFPGLDVLANPPSEGQILQCLETFKKTRVSVSDSIGFSWKLNGTVHKTTIKTYNKYGLFGTVYVKKKPLLSRTEPEDILPLVAIIQGLKSE